MDKAILDLEAGWGAELRDFLHYVVEVSDPVVVDEWDQKVLDALTEANAAIAAHGDEVLDLLSNHGMAMRAPVYGLTLGFYNFARPTVIGEEMAAIAQRVIASLDGLLETYGDSEELSERQVRYIAGEVKATVEQHSSAIAKLLEAAHAAASGDGAAVEEEEEVAPLAEGETPWHDDSLSLDERMAMAKGGGLFEKLYAAMAQTDCTACGYDCEGYAQAIFDGEESDLGKCAPGEEETQEMIESLVKAGR